MTIQKYNPAIALLFLLPYLPIIVPSSTAIFNSGFYLHDITAVFLVIPIIFIYIKKHPASLTIYSTQIFILLFVCLLSLQLPFLASYKTYSYMTISILFLGMLLTVIIQSVINNKAQLITWLAATLLINSYLQIIICILQIYDVKLYIPLHIYNYDLSEVNSAFYNLLVGDTARAGGSVYQPNLLANTLSCGLFANTVLFGFSNRKSKVLWLVSCLFLSIFIGLTFSRTAVLYDLFMLIYGAILFFRHQKQAGIILTIQGIILIACILLAGKGIFNHISPQFAAAYNNENQSRILLSISGHTANTQESATANIETSNSQRIIYAQHSLTAFEKHPLLGVGWGYYAQSLYNDCLKETNCHLLEFALPTNAHNLFLQTLATTGIFGFIILCLAFGYWFIKLLTLPPQLQILPLGFFMVNLLHSQLEYPLFYVAYLYCFLIMVALADDKPLFSIRSRLIKPGLLVISIITSLQIYCGINNFFTLAQYRKPDNVTSPGMLTVLSNKYLIGNNPFWDYYADADIANKTIVDKRTQNNHLVFDMIYNAVQRVDTFTPYPYFTLKLAFLEQCLGNSDKAKILVANVCKVYPGNQNNLVEFVNIFINKDSQVKTIIIGYIDQFCNDAHKVKN